MPPTAPTSATASIIAAFAKQGFTGILLLALIIIVYIIVTSYGTKLDSLSNEVDVLSNSVSSYCGAKPEVAKSDSR